MKHEIGFYQLTNSLDENFSLEDLEPLTLLITVEDYPNLKHFEKILVLAYTGPKRTVFQEINGHF